MERRAICQRKNAGLARVSRAASKTPACGMRKAGENEQDQSISLSFRIALRSRFCFTHNAVPKPVPFRATCPKPGAWQVAGCAGRAGMRGFFTGPAISPHEQCLRAALVRPADGFSPIPRY